MPVKMRLKTATIDDLLSWHPCYSETQIRQWAGDATTFTALDVLRHPDIKAADKFWVVLRPEMLDDRTIRLFACDRAEAKLPLYEGEYPGDDRPRRAIETARRYANGEATIDELDAAWADARYAARNAWYAAGTAWDAWAAAKAAARAAARDVALYAAAGAEQIEMLLRLVDPGVEYVLDRDLGFKIAPAGFVTGEESDDLGIPDLPPARRR